MPSSAELLCIAPGDHTRAVWPAARHMIRRAIMRTGLGNFAAVERAVLDGQQLLWLAWNGDKIEAAATTELALTERGKICVLVACAGTQSERWLHLIDGIEAYASNEGCAGMRIYGRKGWGRVLNGYRVRYAILEKALS